MEVAKKLGDAMIKAVKVPSDDDATHRQGSGKMILDLEVVLVGQVQ